jgi:hypothetical protein
LEVLQRVIPELGAVLHVAMPGAPPLNWSRNRDNAPHLAEQHNSYLCSALRLSCCTQQLGTLL